VIGIRGPCPASAPLRHPETIIKPGQFSMEIPGQISVEIKSSGCSRRSRDSYFCAVTTCKSSLARGPRPSRSENDSPAHANEERCRFAGRSRPDQLSVRPEADVIGNLRVVICLEAAFIGEARSSSRRADFESWAEDILGPADAPSASRRLANGVEPPSPTNPLPAIGFGFASDSATAQTAPASCRIVGVAPTKLIDHVRREIVALLRPQFAGRSRRQQE
jgi:hypothetical protein